jgi:hypothetical protein
MASKDGIALDDNLEKRNHFGSSPEKGCVIGGFLELPHGFGHSERRTVTAAECTSLPLFTLAMSLNVGPSVHSYMDKSFVSHINEFISMGCDSWSSVLFLP